MTIANQSQLETVSNANPHLFLQIPKDGSLQGTQTAPCQRSCQAETHSVW